MQRIIITITVSFSLLFLSASLKAQSAADNAHRISDHIANKMKDTLLLTSQQKDSLYAINTLLHLKKNNIWQQYAASDSLRWHLRKVENTRDSLYKRILTISQFSLYQQKKGNLITID